MSITTTGGRIVRQDVVIPAGQSLSDPFILGARVLLWVEPPAALEGLHLGVLAGDTAAGVRALRDTFGVLMGWSLPPGAAADRLIAHFSQMYLLGHELIRLRTLATVTPVALQAQANERTITIACWHPYN